VKFEGQRLGWGGAAASLSAAGRRRVLARFVRLRGLWIVVVLVAASALLAGLPWAQSEAVEGAPAGSSAAQVRLFENGQYAGSGTLVDRNWVLAAAHQFNRPDNPRIYSFRFGVVNNQNDQSDPTHLRSADRIVFAPRGDLAMVHFVDPVPAGTWIPRLANQAPGVLDWARIYGWGQTGDVLRRASALVYDPIAIANAAARRAEEPDFSAVFPPGIDPMVLDLDTEEGDGGSGVFSPRGVLAGVNAMEMAYLDVNSSGNFVQPEFRASMELPVWQYRQWILDTISGAGPSNPDPEHDELRRRRLDETKGRDLPMTAPPQVDFCDEGDPTCSLPDPVWRVATLAAPGGGDGLVAAACPSGEGNSCSFNGSLYAPGASGRVKVGSGRQVMVWCKTTDALTVGSGPQSVLRVSFTNAEHDEGPIGHGWWDVSPGQVTVANGPVDTAPFATC
jgi:hypothetical protein